LGVRVASEPDFESVVRQATPEPRREFKDAMSVFEYTRNVRTQSVKPGPLRRRADENAPFPSMKELGESRQCEHDR
jgi:hypothetical protein